MKLKQNTPVSATALLGIGSYRPEKVVTNDDLAEVMDTNDEWIRTRVGIHERRFADKEQTVPDLGVIAGNRAIADAGLKPEDIDSVILATCTMPCGIPNAAAQTASRIGIENKGAFDLNAACAGFCYGIGTASDLVRSGSAGRVLVIGAEKLTDSVDPFDRANAIIFADGAGAAVVGPAEEPGIGPVSWGSAGELVDLIYMRENRYIFQQGQSVFRWASSEIAPLALRAVEAAGLEPADIDVLVSHQANLRIVEAIAKKLHASGAREDLVVADDIVTTGNTSSASIPLAMDRMRAAGKIKSGDVALLAGFGAGLSYASQVVVCP